MKTGMLISFEGIDGSGKSTQASLCAAWLEERGMTVRRLREPGGTALGEYIRSALLDNTHADMTPESELMLFLAARAQLTARVITPALDAGEVVILDRYIDSTTAYQGYARGLGAARVADMNLFATGGLLPDITVIIDIDPRTGLGRLESAPDRLESEGIAFMDRVREGYRQIHRLSPVRVVWCDGTDTIENIQTHIRNEITSRVHGVL